MAYAAEEENGPLVLYDGGCGFCTWSVQWLIQHDKKNTFRFVAIQSEPGRACYQRLGLDPENINTFVLINGQKAWIKSDAILEVAKNLGGKWRWLMLVAFIPRPIRNFFYDRFAQYRVHFMG